MLTGSLRLKGDGLAFYTEYDAEFVDDVKRIPGRRWNADAKVWVVPMTESARALALATEYGVAISPQIAERAEAATKLAELSSAAGNESVVDVPGVAVELRPYQKAGVEYLSKQKRSILADEMGTGKTLISLAAVAAQNKWPAVVVCPASLRLNWAREVGKFFPGKTAAVIGLGGEKKRAGEIAAAVNADVVVINYDILAKSLPALKQSGILDRAGALIADEAHYIKDLKTQRGAAIMDLSRPISARGGLVVLATGTPVINRPKDLISPLRILGALDSQFGGWQAFVTRYCGGVKTRFGWDIDGASNLKELELKIRGSCYIRRTKDQVLTELPEKQRSVISVSMTATGGKDYGACEKDMSRWAAEKGKPLTAFAGGGDGAEVLTRIGRLRQIVGHAKTPATVEFAQGILDSGEKAIIFAIHKEVQGEIYQSLDAAFPGEVVRITGEMGPEDRQASVDAFQSGKARAIVCSQRAAGVGLTLTAASNVVFAEYDWTAASHDQAEDRAHRMGQKSAVNAWYIHAPDTIDEAMAAIVEEKRGIAYQVMGDSKESQVKSPGDVKRILKMIEGRAGNQKNIDLAPEPKPVQEPAPDTSLER